MHPPESPRRHPEHERRTVDDPGTPLEETPSTAAAEVIDDPFRFKTENGRTDQPETD